MKAEADLPVYQQQVVFIFDECHRSQFGEAQKTSRKIQTLLSVWFYRYAYFPGKCTGAETTASVFGRELHSYVITDAIRDEKC